MTNQRPRARGWIAAGVVLSVVLVAGIGALGLVGDDVDRGVCGDPAAAELEATVDAALGWMDRAGQADGRWWYEYDRVADQFDAGYHVVRHGGVLMSIYQVAAERPGDTAVLAIGDDGRAHLYDNLQSDGSATAFGYSPRRLHLGGTALAVAALVHRRIATGDTADDSLLREMGEFLRVTLRDDGGMWFGADLTADGFVPTVGETSTFYTGEAFWAFGLLANQFPGEGWDDDARAVGHYIATARDEEEGIDDPPLADQWSAYGFAEMRDWHALSDPAFAAELAYVRSLIGQYHGRVDRETGREANRVGDGSGPPDETVRQSRGAAFGTTVEALSALWRLAETDPGVTDLADQVRGDLVCGASILAARQYDADRAAGYTRPDVVEGAWFHEDSTRMDDQQHAMSGVLLAIDAAG